MQHFGDAHSELLWHARGAIAGMVWKIVGALHAPTPCDCELVPTGIAGVGKEPARLLGFVAGTGWEGTG